MNRVPVSKSSCVNERRVQSVKLLERLVKIRGIERAFDFLKSCLAGFVKEILIAPEPFLKLFFEQRLEITALTVTISQTERIKTISDITRKQLVSALAREHHRNACMS